MKNVVLTLDYELFFIKSGTPELSIIEPTKYLIKVLEQIDGKATFFIDTLYLLALKSSKHLKDNDAFKCIEEQLLGLVARGHRIELHLHPHWVDAYESDNEWIFPTYDHYKLSSLSDQTIISLFDESIELLTSIAQKVIPDYKVTAFRAGGWCVEPFNKIQYAFKKHDLKIDSSIAPGMLMCGDIHQLDYSDLPASSHYKFSNNVRVTDPIGEYLEIPINGYYLSPLEKIYLFLANKMDRENASIWGNGKGIQIVARRNKLLILKDLLLRGKQFNQYSFDGYVIPKLIENKMLASKLPFISIVAHPKLLTPSSLNAISYLGEKDYKFITLQDLYQQIV